MGFGEGISSPSGEGSGEGRSPSPDFFSFFQMEMVHLYAMSLLKTTLLKVKTSSAAANYDGLDMKSSAKAMLGVTLRQLPARQCQVKT